MSRDQNQLVSSERPSPLPDASLISTYPSASVIQTADSFQSILVLIRSVLDNVDRAL